MPEPMWTIEQKAMRAASRVRREGDVRASNEIFSDAIGRYANYASALGLYQTALHQGLTDEQWVMASAAFHDQQNLPKPIADEVPEQVVNEAVNAFAQQHFMTTYAAADERRVARFVAPKIAAWVRAEVAAEILRPYEGVTNTAMMSYEEAAVWSAMQELAERLGVPRG